MPQNQTWQVDLRSLISITHIQQMFHIFYAGFESNYADRDLTLFVCL